MTNSRIVLVSLLAGVTALAATSGGTAQNASPKNQKSESGLVKVSLIVTDLSDHSIDTLRKEDIRLLEDGVPQPISSFSKDDRPVDYGIAVDRSGSLRRVLQVVIDTAKAIIKNNRPGDETFVESFVSSDKIETNADFTADKDYLFDTLDSLFVESGHSAVNDAVYLAVEYIAKHGKGNDNRRRALVLITDGDDRNSFYQQPALEKLLTEKDVQIFIIGFVSEVSIKPTQEERARGYRTRDEAVALLMRIAEVTGGRAFFPNGIAEIDRAVSEIDRDLHNQYSITYQPTERKPGFHKITVEITSASQKDKLKVITRPGYFIPSAEKPKDKKPK
jgi:Ca-activated chloride channel family protein